MALSRASAPMAPGLAFFDRHAAELACHYHVEAARVQWDCGGEVRPLGHFGPHSAYVPTRPPGAEGIVPFSHHISRELPVIIADALNSESLGEPIRVEDEVYNFYAAAPLLSASGAKFGAISILGRSPRPGFGLADCRALEERAREIAGMVEQLGVDVRRGGSAIDFVIECACELATAGPAAGLG